MFGDMRIGVVIPCYRAESAVADVIARIPDFVDTVVAVNDASPDGTLEVLESITSPHLTVVSHEQNRGLGGAMVTGFRRILEDRPDIVVKLDADGQMDPALIPELIRPIAAGVCDYAKGNRFQHFQALARMPLSRKIGNIALTFLTKIASGHWHIFDPQNGFVAIRADFLPRLNLDRLSTRRYFFENEMLIQLNIGAARILDCPMPAIYGDETSSLRIRHVLCRFPPLLVRGFFARLLHRHVLRDFSVIIPLYLLGTLFFIWGFGFGAWAWARSIHTGIPATTGTVMLSVLPLILGFQMLLQGLLIDILQSPRPEWFGRAPGTPPADNRD